MSDDLRNALKKLLSEPPDVYKRQERTAAKRKILQSNIISIAAWTLQLNSRRKLLWQW